MGRVVQMNIRLRPAPGSQIVLKLPQKLIFNIITIVQNYRVILKLHLK